MLRNDNSFLPMTFLPPQPISFIPLLPPPHILLPLPPPPPPPPPPLPLFMINNPNNDFGYMGEFKIIERRIKSDNSVWNYIYNHNTAIIECYLDGYYTPNVYYNKSPSNNGNYLNNSNNKNIGNIDSNIDSNINSNIDKYRAITLNEMLENLSNLNLSNNPVNTVNTVNPVNPVNPVNTNKKSAHKRKKSYDANLAQIKEEITEDDKDKELDNELDNELDDELDDEPPPLSYFENDQEIFV